MRTLPLGSEGLAVSAQGLGCMGMSAFYGPRDDDESLRMEENAAAVDLVLSPDELSALDGIAAQVAGERYADMSAVPEGRD